jgi:hypothetical protein
MSNNMSLDEMLPLNTDIKINGGDQGKINIDSKRNKNESQTYVNGSFDKLNYFKSDDIKLRIINYTNESTIIIDEINNKIYLMKTIFEYRSSSTKRTKKLNQNTGLIKKIYEY